MTFEPEKLKQIVEGALLAAGKPLSLQRLAELFEESEPKPGRDEIQAALEDLAGESTPRGFEIVEVASGYRIQVKESLAPWVSRLWEEKPQRYSRALLETLALVAYRQPITRGEIEDIRGVAVSTNIIRTLLDRDWVRVVGHREVPGRPAMYATTRSFLDYFNLKNLDQLPSLAAIRDLDSISTELGFSGLQTEAPPAIEGQADDPEANDAEANEKPIAILAAVVAESLSGGGPPTEAESATARHPGISQVPALPVGQLEDSQPDLKREDEFANAADNALDESDNESGQASRSNVVELPGS
jgi:segregation and condensation protein B